MTEPNSADHSAPAWINDAHWGQGGRFVFDPVTGQRTRQAAAEDAENAMPDQPAPTDQPDPTEPPPMKGKKHG